MSNTIKNSIGAAALGLLLAQGAAAEAPMGESEFAPGADLGLLIEQFGAMPGVQVEPLDGAQMDATRGELWPLIGAVVTVDLALATFFWGTYVPTVTGTTPIGGLLTSQQY